MATYDLGKVVGDAGEKGDDGSTVWNTSTAPTYANSKYTFTKTNLSGKTGLTVAVNDIIFYSTYYYIVSAVNSTTVDCSTRVSIKGSDASVTIVDNLTSDSSTSVLSAKQGKVLNTNKIETSAIATSFGSTTSDSKVPSEKLVKTELDKKIATSNTAGLVKNDGTIDTNTYLTSSSLSNYVAKSETTGLLKNDGTVDTNSYSTTSHTHGQVTSDGKVTSTAVTVASGDNILITDYSDSSKIKRVANILADHVKDSTAHSNIGSSANDTQATINSDIDTALSGKQATLVSGTNIKTVNNESLLGSGNITIQGGSSVDVVTSWEATLSDTKVPSEKLVKNTIDGLSIPTKTSDLTNDGADGTNVYVANNDSRLSDSRTPTSHTHGNLTNDGKVGSNANYIVVTGTGGAITSVQKLGNITYDGKIGSTSGKPIITTTSGTLTTGSFGSTSGTFAEGNHTHSGYASSTHTHGNLSNDGKLGTTSGKPVITTTGGAITTGSFGSTSGTFAEGNHTHSAYVNPTKVTSWSSTPSNDNVASEKLIKDSLDAKQATLVSGTNIKTINNNSLLGEGNITIQGGGGSGGSYINDFYGDSSTNELIIDYDTGVSQADIVTSWSSTTSDTNVPSEKLAKDTLDNKIDKSSTTGLVKNDGSIMTSGTGSTNYSAGNHTHSGYVSATKVTSWSSTVSDSNVPSEKLVKNYIDDQIGTAIQYIQQ